MGIHLGANKSIKQEKKYCMGIQLVMILASNCWCLKSQGRCSGSQVRGTLTCCPPPPPALPASRNQLLAANPFSINSRRQICNTCIPSIRS